DLGVAAAELAVRPLQLAAGGRGRRGLLVAGDAAAERDGLAAGALRRVEAQPQPQTEGGGAAAPVAPVQVVRRAGVGAAAERGPQRRVLDGLAGVELDQRALGRVVGRRVVADAVDHAGEHGPAGLAELVRLAAGLDGDADVGLGRGDDRVEAGVAGAELALAGGRAAGVAVGV